MRKKGSYPLQLKTLFGNVTVDSPRYYLPPTEAGPKTFSPLQHLFPQHVTPERLYLETKLASLILYQKTADLLHDVLPLSAKLSGTTIQQHLHAVVEAQEQQLPQEVAPFHGVCQRNREALLCPPRPLVVGLDGGYVRHWHRKGCFEVIAGKSIPTVPPNALASCRKWMPSRADESSRCCARKGCRRIRPWNSLPMAPRFCGR
jgi:hypothetical protein